MEGGLRRRQPSTGAFVRGLDCHRGWGECQPRGRHVLVMPWEEEGDCMVIVIGAGVPLDCHRGWGAIG
jgi:hypothetical protein